MHRFAIGCALGATALALTACANYASQAPAAAPTTASTGSGAAAAAAAPATAGPAGTSQSGAPATPGRTAVNGKVATVEAGKLTLDNGQSFPIDDKTTFRRQVAVQPSDLKVGEYVGVTAKRQPDNTLLASMINIIPNVGETFQRPMNGGNLMTNAVIESVSGNTFTLTFPGGGFKVTLAPDAKIFTSESATKDDLKPGAAVVVFGTAGSTASTIQLLAQ